MAERARILEMHVGSVEGGPMEPRTEIVIDENGIVDGRYPFNGFYSGKRIPDPDRAVTLISSEGIANANAALEKEGIAPFIWSDTRRDLIVDMGPNELNSLKEKGVPGKRVRIGEVILEATDPCTPCVRLAELRGVPPEDRPKVVKAFLTNGGMRFKVIRGGRLFGHEEIEVLDNSEEPI